MLVDGIFADKSCLFLRREVYCYTSLPWLFVFSTVLFNLASFEKSDLLETDLIAKNGNAA